MDNLFIGNEASEKMMEGVRKVSNAVGSTMGTSGRNVIIETLEYPGLSTTNDGATIVSAIKLSDPLEDLGRKTLNEAVSRANRASGDGSSTTCVLTAAILEEGKKYLKDASVMEIKRSLEQCIPLIEESINAQKKEITVDSVADVATVSGEDPKMGAMIQEIYQKIGPKGIIQWDLSKTPEDHYEIGSGITVNGMGWVSPYMCDRDEKTGFFTNSIKRKNPKILLTKQKVSSIHELNRLGEHLSQEDAKEVIIFCEEVDRQAIDEALQVWQMFKTIFVKMPVLWSDEWWEDLALATGATIIGADSGIRLNKAGKEHCGTVERITIGKEDTVLEGVNDMSKHTLALQVDGSDAALLRASRLNVQTARYYVGGYSDQGVYYRRLKLEDAINAASCALEHGVVAGGGVTLLKTGHELPDTIGGKILRKSLEEPFKKILQNAGAKPELEVFFDGRTGYDSKTQKKVDMFKVGIVDATDVTLGAVKNAIGVAASILTAGSVVTIPKEENK